MRGWRWLLVGIGAFAPAQAADLDAIASKGGTIFELAAALRDQGVAIPEHALPAATRALAVNNSFSDAELESIARRADGFLAELDLLATNPAAVGSAKMVPGGDAVAGGSADVVLIYEPGRRLVAGDELLLLAHGSMPGAVQNADPDAGNYVAIDAPPGVSFTSATEISEGMRGSLRGHRMVPVFRLTEGVLEPGTTLRIELSDLDLPFEALGRFLVPLFIRFEPGGHPFQVPVEPMAIGPGALSRL